MLCPSDWDCDCGFWRTPAAYLVLPVPTLYRMNSLGTGPRYFKIGRHCRYDPADVAAWLDARASAPSTRVPA